MESGWGGRIRERREKLQLNQADLAKKAGLGSSSGFISEIERELKRPGADALFAIAKVLGASMDWICGGQAAPNPDGLPREVRDAVQRAVQMVEDFLSVVPPDKRSKDPAKVGLFVTTVAELLIAGRQEEIPALMVELMRAYSDQAKSPSV